MKSVIHSLPDHLKKYVVEQDYDKYTPEDQAVWRYIMRQLKSFLSQHAHPLYVEGLEKTGITIDKIPLISDMNDMLKKFGWGAVPVSGFIPPAAFMEFQSLGVLPIASDVRSLDHILYTPAPDIVHEAAGHAPILIDPDYAAYLKQYAEVARHALMTRQDLDQYEAIRILSDVKENPASTPADIEKAEQRLNEVNAAITFVSEAGWLSRMNWWTAEYGLIGSPDKPKIYGAGLLSSVGEAKTCLQDSVKKIPLTVDCIETSYDITEKQPQLFVTPNFEHLHLVLEDLAKKLAYRIGGAEAIERAKQAETINTVELDSGLQVSGIVDRVDLDSSGKVCFFHLNGRSQLSRELVQLADHGPDYHSHGYSTPIGAISKFNKPLHLLSSSERDRLGLNVGTQVKIQFNSGVVVEGRLQSCLLNNKQLDLLSFKDCWVKNGEEVLFQPDWGGFDMACAGDVTSVFAGPADRLLYAVEEDFVASRVPQRNITSKEQQLYGVFQKIRGLQNQDHIIEKDFESVVEEWSESGNKNWLAGLELYEIALHRKIGEDHISEIAKSFDEIKDPAVKTCLKDGLDLAKSELF
jgi:phenylalanine-4-hydroxylase